MKKNICILGICISLFSIPFAVSAEDKITVHCDGQQVTFDVEPQIINGRTMVPIRAIFEQMGATVDWDNETRTAISVKGDTTVKMTVDSTTMSIDDEEQAMDVSPVIIDGRTLAPARYVAEAFGNTVVWSEAYKNVVICSEGIYAYADYPDIPDLGKCYNLTPVSEKLEDGCRVISYVYKDKTDDKKYAKAYENSLLALDRYTKTENEGKTEYIKDGQKEARYYIVTSEDNDKNTVFKVYIKDAKYKGQTVTLYSLDGKTKEVYENEVRAHLKDGWCKTFEETRVMLYSPDGKSMYVFKAEADRYKEEGWRTMMNEKILIIGDSISTFKGYIAEGCYSYYPDQGDGSVASVYHTWWKMLERETNSNVVLNSSWSGTTLCNTGYDGDVSNTSSFIFRLEELIEKGFFEQNEIDRVFVFGGTNDSWLNTDCGELMYDNWKKNDLFLVLPGFSYLVDKLMSVVPKEDIHIIINEGIKTEVQFGMMDICDHYGVNYTLLEGIEVVGGHPTYEGMKKIKDQVLEDVR